MINIPTTDIMTPITGDANKAILADQPSNGETSFLGVINASIPEVDQRGDTFGSDQNTDSKDKNGKPDLLAFDTVIIGNVMVSIQQDTGQLAPGFENVTSDEATNLPSVLDGKEILPNTMLDHDGSQRDLPADPPIINVFDFALNQSVNAINVSPHIDDKEGGVQTAVQSAHIAETAGQNHPQKLQSNNALPTFDVQSGQLESSIAVLSPPLGEPAISLPDANRHLPNGTAQSLKTEITALDKVASAQQIENVEQPTRTTNARVNQRPNKGTVIAEQPVLQSYAKPSNAAGSENSVLASIPLNKALPAQSEIPLVPRQGIHASPSLLQSDKTGPDHPVMPAPSQGETQNEISAPKRPLHELSMSPPSVASTNQSQTQISLKGAKSAPKSETIMPPAPEGPAQFAGAPKSSSPIVEPAAPDNILPKTNPSGLASADTPDSSRLPLMTRGETPQNPQPSTVTKSEIEASEFSQPAAHAPKITKPTQPRDIPVAAASDSNQTRTAPKLTASKADKIKVGEMRTEAKPEQVKPTPHTVVPKITPMDTVEPLETLEFAPLESRSVDVTTPMRNDSNLNRPEVMRHVAQQMTEAARHMPDRPVELALNPEELGRVRLTFTTTDTSIHVAVVAERGETLDMMRRHIETLAQDFRDLGYRDVKFDFSGNGAQNHANQSGNNQAEPENVANLDAPPQENPEPINLSLEPSARLDLRL